jgi:Protein of unknown function (DUF4013)
MSLRDALRNLHADRAWWRKILIGGALSCSLLAHPLAAGLVIESLDNTRKGFSTPLPEWVELSSRYILGLFGFLIDFLFFVVPFFIAGLLFFCFGLITVLGGDENSFNPVTMFGGFVLLGTIISMFAVGVSPVGRLVFVQDSSPEKAMSSASLREALRSGVRIVYLRARLTSLPAYIPFLFFGTLLVLLIPSGLPFSWLLGLLLYWLTMSALLYAHILVIQIYAGAEAELQKRGLERMPE